MIEVGGQYDILIMHFQLGEMWESVDPKTMEFLILQLWKIGCIHPPLVYGRKSIPDAWLRDSLPADYSQF